MSEPGLVATLAPILKEAQRHAVVIRDGDTDLGAVVSMEDYEIVRRAKAERFLRASDELGAQMRARAAAEGLTVDDLMKLLDRKAS
ncbi:MAG TPA: hypothetical protein VGU23_03975 [Acidobacteriaceae bacterium]|nr:hypothetical protein [Acidobacteriaceae bacterium]